MRKIHPTKIDRVSFEKLYKHLGEKTVFVDTNLVPEQGSGILLRAIQYKDFAEKNTITFDSTKSNPADEIFIWCE